MNTTDCKCYSKGLNYIIWKHSVTIGGIFIVHIGGSNKRLLYRMMQELLKEEFDGNDVYFCTQSDEYWKNHSVLDGTFRDGTKVYKYIHKLRR